ncbi:MAG: hypothetical protein LQ337_008725 [Flavoplaca oasis]|nr:MAG: hypothetical protein LQ337_008725 [Flavoplaca oasis]
MFVYRPTQFEDLLLRFFLRRRPLRLQNLLLNQPKFPKLSVEQSRLSSTVSYGKKRMEINSLSKTTRLIHVYRGAQNQNFFLNSRTDVPLKSEFRPAMQVLSRKPAKPTSTSAVTSGLGQLSVDDDDDDEDDETTAKVLTAEERQLKAQKEREEKQKKYDVARERILGNGSATAGKPSGSTTPPTRGKVHGGSRGPSRNRTALEGRNATSSGSGAGPPRLYDPNYTAKPDSAFSPTGSTPNGSGRSTPIEQQLIRNPRGPDGSGRGGFGFASRGGKV